MIYNHRLYQEDLNFLIQEALNWERLAGKHILVTGASGMIGTFLIDALMKRNEVYHSNIVVYALSRSSEKLMDRFGRYTSEGNHCLYLIKQDVAQELQLTNYDIDYIIHAASNTHPREYSSDPVGTITSNVFGAYWMLEYAKAHTNCRVVLLSSVEVYGENRGDTCYFDESYCGYINCNTLRAGYPESKRLSEAMLQAYITQHGADGVIVRLSRIYGPTVSSDDSKAISQFIRKAVAGEDIVLKSKGTQLYSYTYTADAVHAILRCMTDGVCGEAYNVADRASDMTLKGIAEYLARLSEVRVVFESPDGDEQRGYSTATKALLNAEKLRQLGWRARYSMEDGLKRTVTILKGEGPAVPRTI